MPKKGRGRQGQVKVSSLFLQVKFLVTCVCNSYFQLNLIPDNAATGNVGWWSSKLAGVSDEFQFYRVKSFSVEVSPALANATSTSHPFIIGYNPGIALIAPTSTSIMVELPWCMPLMGASVVTGIGLTTVIKRSIPKRILMDPQLPWFRTRLAGSVDNDFEVQGQLWIFVPTVNLGGDTINFICEATYEFKSPIQSSLTPARGAGTLERYLQIKDGIVGAHTIASGVKTANDSGKGVSLTGNAAISHIEDDTESKGSDLVVL
jgi:hypothetical protein